MLANGKHIDTILSIAGPVIIDDAVFLTEISHPLKLKLPLYELLPDLEPDSFSFPSISKLIRMLQGGSFGLTVQDGVIHTPFDISLPVRLSIPSVHIPYSFSVDLSDTNARKALTLTTLPMDMEFKEDAVRIKGELRIFPQNTEAAALAMASIVNPIFMENKVRFYNRDVYMKWALKESNIIYSKRNNELAIRNRFRMSCSANSK